MNNIVTIQDALWRLSNCENEKLALSEELAEVKKERDELAAQVAVLRKALERNHRWHNEYSEDEGYADSDLCEENTLALAITPSEALREVEARVLEEAAPSMNSWEGKKYLQSVAAAKRKGEQK